MNSHRGDGIYKITQMAEKPHHSPTHIELLQRA